MVYSEGRKKGLGDLKTEVGLLDLITWAEAGLAGAL